MILHLVGIFFNSVINYQLLEILDGTRATKSKLGIFKGFDGLYEPCLHHHNYIKYVAT